MEENNTGDVVLGIDFYGNDTFQLILYFIVFFAGILGNALIFAVYFKKKRRTSTDIFILALSMIDLVASIQIVIQIIRIWIPSVITDNFCIMNWTSGEATAFASLLLTFAICVDRYMVICRPFSSRLTNKWAVIWAVSCVILSILLMAPKILIIGATKLGRPVKKTICEAKRNVWFLRLVQVMYPLMCFGVMIPTLYLYHKIYVSLRRRGKIHADLLGRKPKSSGKDCGQVGQAMTSNLHAEPIDNQTEFSRCGREQSAKIRQSPTAVSRQFLSQTVSNNTKPTSGKLLQSRSNKNGPSTCKLTSCNDMMPTEAAKKFESADSVTLEGMIHLPEQISMDSAVNRLSNSNGDGFDVLAECDGKAFAQRNDTDLACGKSKTLEESFMNADIKKPISNVSFCGQSFDDHGHQTAHSGILGPEMKESRVSHLQHCSNRRTESKKYDMGQATTRMLLIITIYFFITWLPYVFAASFYSQLLHLLPRDSVEFIFLILNAIRGTNHIVNILVYYYANQWFRKALRKLLCGRGTVENEENAR